MRIKKLNPKKIVLGFRQIIFTFSETSRLVWRANPGLLATAFAANIVTGLLVFPTLYIEKLIIDALIQNVGSSLTQDIIRFFILLFSLRVIIGVVQSAASRISSYVQYRVARVFSVHIDLLLGAKLDELDVPTLESPTFKDRYNKVERESGRRSWELAMPLSQIPNFFFSMVSALSIFFFFRPWVAGVIFLLAIPEFFIDAKYTKLEYDLNTKFANKNRIWGWMSYYLVASKNFLELKLLRLSPYFIQKVKQISGEIYGSFYQVRKKREQVRFLTYLPQNIFDLVFSLYAALATIAGQITVGSAQMFIRAIYSFQGSLTGLVGSFIELYENYLFVGDLIWFLNLHSQLATGKRRFPEKGKQIIELKDVWFKYKDDQPWVLKGVNLKIESKENLAIVGENGAGKTTLIKLLCHFYDPQKGEILINGVNLKEINQQDLWRHFSVLFQKFEPYPFTAREAVGYGQVEEIDNLPAIVQAAKKSLIHDYLDSLPLKYENPLSADFEKGTEPSTGQWQRIGLARVLVRNARIVILDEPTSNVDAKAEEEIFRKIEELAEDKILILISHRFSTVRRAHKICVMDKGKIIEEGTHQELMKKKGMYAELFELQAKSYR